MGDIVGGIIGGVGGLLGASGEAKAAKAQAQAQRYAADKAAETARLGFDYLTGSPIAKTYLPMGAQATERQGALLGLGGDTAAAGNAFRDYLGSTGYEFQMGEGQRAITSNAASRGLLNSGATLKALTKYGQGLGGSAFQQYLQNLGGLSAAGLSAGGVIGGAGSQAGGTGAQAISQGYGAAAGTQGAGIRGQYQGYGEALGSFGNAFSRAIQPGGGSGGYYVGGGSAATPSVFITNRQR